MKFTTDNILLLGSLMLFISILASKGTFRTGIPTLLLFMLIGMLAGSDGIGGIYFYDPELSQLIGVMALNFILFSGGMETKWATVKPVLKHGILLSTLGVVITAVTVAAFVYLIADFSIAESLLLGSIVSSTDAAAVFSILKSRRVGLKGNLRPILELESGSNDPMAYFLTITFTQFIQEPELSGATFIIHFVQEMTIGAVTGILFGRVATWIVNKINLDIEGLYPVLILSLMLFTFSSTDFVGGNGFLAVYLSAIVIGNGTVMHKRSLMKFYDGQAWLMQIIMFITLGMLVFPSEIPPVMPIGLAISFLLMFVARPLGVFICLSFFKMNFREKLFISWVGLRGAVPIVFATYPLIAGIDKADMIFNLVFFISATSVLLQGTSLALVAKWLHLLVPENKKRISLLDMEMEDTIKTELNEIELTAGASAIGKTIVELNFPKPALIVLIKRANKYVTPNGSTQLEQGDRLLIMADHSHAMKQVYHCLGLDGKK